MTKNINQVELTFPQNRDELISVAVSQNESCVSVGGLVEELDMIQEKSQ